MIVFSSGLLLVLQLLLVGGPKLGMAGALLPEVTAIGVKAARLLILGASSGAAPPGNLVLGGPVVV